MVSLEVDHRTQHGHPRRVVVRGENQRIQSEYQADFTGPVEELAGALARQIDGEVGFDSGSRALYATDASNYRQVPLGVVVPRSVEDIVKTVALCRDYAAPIVMRGGGTSLAGQGCNVAVLIDCSKHLDHVLNLDAQRRLAVVEPGCVLDTLRDAAAKHRLTFGPDPATHDHNTLGGMLGNNSCGVHSVMAGRTSDNVRSLDVLTYDGLRLTVGPTGDEEFERIVAGGGRRAEIYRALAAFRTKYHDLILKKYPKIPRRVSGYENLDALFPDNGFNVARALVGTEGTCVTILQATLELVPSRPERIIAIVGFDDVFAAADAIPHALTFKPIGLEGIDHLLVEYMLRKHLNADDVSMLPEGRGWLLAEFGADDRQQALAQAETFARAFRDTGHAAAVVKEEAQQKKLWELRESALGATAHVPGMPETHPGWEDSAVSPIGFGRYLRDLKALFHDYGYDGTSVYGHFGDGLVHCRVPFELRTEKGLQRWSDFMNDAAELVVRHGGTLSGEHGDGQARAALLDKMYGSELIQAFREFKAIWDPDGKMNPGRIVDPYPITSNLRIGPQYQPAEPKTYFAYAEDGGSFAKATRRCVGVGKCRRHGSDDGVMCPSYMATREEKHSTRGRARLLFEMLHGGAITDGWKSQAIEDALDLCLACKGCKSDCPVHVDMATYKAEFRAHHYQGRLRPRPAYSMGLIHRWSRFAAMAPWAANAMLQTPALSAFAKWLGGVAPERRMPRYADETFVQWFRRRDVRARPSDRGRRVMVWPDTFNNYFRPHTAIAAVKILEAGGFSVEIPDRPLCCGRPLYDWGMLDPARKLWRQTLAALAPAIRAGTPIVGLEPACVSAFRDELLGLFPGHEQATRLSGQVYFLTEFLDKECAAGLPRIPRRALVQMHCHHHAVIKMTSELGVLDRTGLHYDVLPSGCCGMAGSFGFERDKYAVSMTAAERVMLPKVREASSETLILANGFSCREQIEQGSGRETLHVAELIARFV